MIMDLNNHKTNTKKNYIECPVCKGTGWWEESILQRINCETNGLPLISNDVKKENKTKKSYTLKTEAKANVSQSFCLESNFQEVKFEDLSVIMQNFLEEPKKCQGPAETIKTSLQKLKQNDCELNIAALKTILSLSQYHSELTGPIVSIIYRKLSSLFQNTRLQVVASAAEISAELFKTIRYIQQPEYDELVLIILQKTAHINKSIRDLTNIALHVMIMNIPPWHYVRVLTSIQGAGHKNPEVRATVGRLLENMIKIIGVSNLLSTPSFKAIRRKIFVVLAQYLIDGSYQTRMSAKNIIKLLLSYSDFEDCFRQDIELKLFKKIEKVFISLKYE